MTDFERLTKLKKQKSIHDTKSKDDWDKYDYELDEKLTKEISELEEKLKNEEYY